MLHVPLISSLYLYYVRSLIQSVRYVYAYPTTYIWCIRFYPKRVRHIDDIIWIMTRVIRITNSSFTWNPFSLLYFQANLFIHTLDVCNWTVCALIQVFTCLGIWSTFASKITQSKYNTAVLLWMKWLLCSFERHTLNAQLYAQITYRWRSVIRKKR